MGDNPNAIDWSTVQPGDLVRARTGELLRVCPVPPDGCDVQVGCPSCNTTWWARKSLLRPAELTLAEARAAVAATPTEGPDVLGSMPLPELGGAP